jgi:photosystem II stability/assembly factor-like uncharacterized protein
MKIMPTFFRACVALLILIVNHAFPQTSFWESTRGPLGGYVDGIAVDSAGRIFTASIGPGIHRSTDNGRSWNQVNNGLDNTAIECLAVSSSGSIFAGGTYNNGGAFRSTDNGENWTRTTNGMSFPYVRSLATNSFGHIFAGTSVIIYRSTDNGESWAGASVGSSFFNNIWDLATAPPAYVFAATDEGVFRSSNNGTSWVLEVWPKSS